NARARAAGRKHWVTSGGLSQRESLRSIVREKEFCEHGERRVPVHRVPSLCGLKVFSPQLEEETVVCEQVKHLKQRTRVRRQILLRKQQRCEYANGHGLRKRQQIGAGVDADQRS